MNSAVTRLLGIARKAGRVEAGEEPAGAAARSGHARVILVACDAADNSVRRAAHFAGGAKIPWLRTPLSKAELGGAVGRTSCAMLAVTDFGLAAAIAGKLAAADPDQYGEAAAALDGKAARALQRQREKRAHEKKLQRAGRKPWAPQSGTKREKERPRPPREAAKGSAAPQRPGPRGVVSIKLGKKTP